MLETNEGHAMSTSDMIQAFKEANLYAPHSFAGTVRSQGCCSLVETTRLHDLELWQFIPKDSQ